MKRKMIGAAVAYMSGLFFASFFTDLCDFLFLVPVALMLFAAAKIRKFDRFDVYIISLSFLAAFTAYTYYTLNFYYGAVRFADTEGNFSGTVADYEIYEGDNASYVLDGTIDGGQKAKIRFSTCELGADFGDVITLEGCTFKPINVDYLFDSEQYYKSEHIFLFVYGAETVSVEKTDSMKIKKAVSLFRDTMIRKIRREIGEKSGGFLTGMIFGEKKYIDDNTKMSLYRSGIGHVLAVSGLHISIISSFLIFVMKKLKADKYSVFAVVNIVCLSFIALAGFPVSAVRAAIMAEIVCAAPLFMKQHDSLNSLAVSAFLISVADPYSIHNSGFILSLVGTFGIIVGIFMSRRIENMFLKKAVGAIFTSVAILPVCMFFFDEVSLVSPLTAVIVIPLCTVALVSGFLYVATVGNFQSFLYISDIFIKIILAVSDFLSSFDFAYIQKTNDFFPFMLIISEISVACLFIVKPSESLVSVASALTVALFSVALAVSDGIHNSRMIVAFVGKGNNSAVVLSYGGYTNIIDLNGNYRSAKYVRKYLSENGINNVAALILNEKSASQYMNYGRELGRFRVNSFFSVNDVNVCDGRYNLLSPSGFSFDTGDYIINYKENIFTITHGRSVLSLSPAKENTKGGGLSVYYGNVVKSTTLFDNSIFLDDVNNFELVFSDDGTFKMRSLYGKD